jgi:tRNA (cmo5U34)-methyltransferase
MGVQFHFNPDTYLQLMAQEVPEFDRLQGEVAAATRRITAAAEGRPVRILELGTGTGETARRVLAIHPDAQLVGIDASEAMLARAREALTNADLRVSRLEDPLPEGPFDLVVSALAVHHLDGGGKADLFRRVAEVLRGGGRFVLGDVVVPDDPDDVVTPIDGDYDTPSRVEEQLRWLADAGLDARVVWVNRDLAVLAADLAEGDSTH